MPAPSPWLTRCAFVDVETTGLDPSVDELVEVGCVFVEAGVVVARTSWRVRPTRPVPPLIRALTGLDDAALADSPPLSDVADDIRQHLSGWTLVAHNASFEKSFLGDLAQGPFVDSCELMHLLFPELDSHALEALKSWAGLGERLEHRALPDAEDTLLVLGHAAERLVWTNRTAEVEAVVEAMSGASEPDAAALAAMLEALAAFVRTESTIRAGLAATTPRPPPPVGSLGDELAGWLGRGPAVVAEIEDPLLVAAAFDAALHVGRSSGQTVLVAVPAKRVKALATRFEGPVLAPARRRVCRAGALALSQGAPEDDADRAGRAYLGAWARRSRAGDIGSLSTWFGHRAPTLATLAARARLWPRCDDALCPRHAFDGASDHAPAVLVSHETALELLAAVGDIHLVVLDARLLAEAATRHLSVTLRPSSVRAVAVALSEVRPGLSEALERHAAELAVAMEGASGLTRGVTLRDRLLPAFLRLRDALLRLGKDLARGLADSEGLPLSVVEELRHLANRAGRVLDTPPEGWETRVASRRQYVELHAGPDVSAALLARRLAGAQVVALDDVCLEGSAARVASLFPGGARFVTRRRDTACAPVVLVRDVLSPAAFAANATLSLAAAGRSIFVAAGPSVSVGTLTEQLHRAAPSLDVRLGAAPRPGPGCVTVANFRSGEGLPVGADAIVLAGAFSHADVRRAIVHLGPMATDIYVAAGSAADAESLRAALAGLQVAERRAGELGADAEHVAPRGARTAAR